MSCNGHVSEFVRTLTENFRVVVLIDYVAHDFQVSAFFSMTWIWEINENLCIFYCRKQFFLATGIVDCFSLLI